MDKEGHFLAQVERRWIPVRLLARKANSKCGINIDSTLISALWELRIRDLVCLIGCIKPASLSNAVAATANASLSSSDMCQVDVQLARAWQLIGRGSCVGMGGLASAAGATTAKSCMVTVGGVEGCLGGIRALTDMVLGVQLKVGDLDCDVLTVSAHEEFPGGGGGAGGR